MSRGAVTIHLTMSEALALSTIAEYVASDPDTMRAVFETNTQVADGFRAVAELAQAVQRA